MALTDNLISHWALDEASGNALDSHGNNDLTETSGTIAAAAGLIGTARDFEADDTEYFTIPDNADLSTGDVDYAFFGHFKAETLSNYPMILQKGWGAGVNCEHSMYLDGGTARMAYAIGHGGTTTTVYAADFGVISLNVWHSFYLEHKAGVHIGISINNSTLQTTPVSSGINSGTSPFVMGADPNGLWWDGLLALISFWKGRILTTDERTRLHNGGAGLAYSEFAPAESGSPVLIGCGFGTFYGDG